MAGIIAQAEDGSCGQLVRPNALFRQPLALQWFEAGDPEPKRRREGERQAGKLLCPSIYASEWLLTDICWCTGRFELFLDLLYVAILANFAENLAEHVGGNQFLKYIVSPFFAS